MLARTSVGVRLRVHLDHFDLAFARRVGAAIVAVSFVAAAAPACTSEDAGVGSGGGGSPSACIESKCAPGNKCLPLDGETKCRKVCSSNVDPATSCPFGYTCVAPHTGGEAFCVQDQAFNDDGSFVTRSAKGQWGAPCNPTGGVINPDCDADQGFYCFGTSPTDATAFCTRYGCEGDRNCGAGFWCATVNTTPNVERRKRSSLTDASASGTGEVHNVCLRREYCSTCDVDLDCPPVEGVPQHCVSDAGGKRFCTTECESSKNCPNEARCADVDGTKVCYPRAGTCVGDGSLCSPCRSDADCGDDGACIKGQFTTERYCAKKSASPCSSSSRGSCPSKLTLATEVVATCSTAASDDYPADYCLALYEIGPETCGPAHDQPCYDLGCWTPKR